MDEDGVEKIDSTCPRSSVQSAVFSKDQISIAKGTVSG